MGISMFELFLETQRQNRPLIISELGAKYASIDVMKEMIKASKECGADMVKFQTYRAETISTPGSFFAMEDGSQVSQYEYFKSYELTPEDHAVLISYCKEIGIGWLSTPSHTSDVDFLETLNPVVYKTGSDDLTNLPFLHYIAKKQRTMIVSTGMCTLGEIEKAVETITRAGNDQLILLHCVVSYPSRPQDANLRVIETLQKAFGIPVGLSDHTTDEYTSILATAMGAVIIEKHFTLDHALKLPDHEAALDPAAFQKLVQKVLLVPQTLGSGVKHILETEEKWRAAARKSIFAFRAIREGEIIQEEDLTIRRPANGIHPHHLDLIVGRQAACDIPEGSLITWNMV
jgi:sialic acid synthase SpsE